MNLLLLLSLLIYSSMHTAGTETLHVRQTVGSRATLYCGNLTNGEVTWSRDTNGQRVDILTTHNGQTTKHIADPDRRYGSGADLALIIRRVSQSDAGRYDCSGATVDLSVTSGTGPNSITTPKTTTTSTPTTTATTTTTSTPATPATTTTTSTAKRRAEDCEMPYDDVYTTIEYDAFNKEQTGSPAGSLQGYSSEHLVAGHLPMVPSWIQPEGAT
ncbi:uncharacterized protein LOC119264342 [Pygocentrus nattereri]|uniref:uncharacterized protein LOC119264342 n=1 Tax=Pygocentrus nattereri TaxID=42514 RepID=UPI001890F57C|nr:uncharacterized protein LOC119264342 [Pygocentrus nattereri]